MNVTVTIDEAATIITKEFSRAGHHVDAVKIEGVHTLKPTLNLMDFVYVANEGAKNAPSYSKIAAIKAVREKGAQLGFTVMLVDAKNFVESLKTW